MIPAVNKYKHLLLVNHTAKAIHHHRHHHQGWLVLILKSYSIKFFL